MAKGDKAIDNNQLLPQWQNFKNSLLLPYSFIPWENKQTNKDDFYQL